MIEGHSALFPPQGDTLNPRNLYKKYSQLNSDEFETLNGELKRVYIGNHKDTRYNTYIQGTYQVLKVIQLNASHLIPQGLIVTLQAMVSHDGYDGLTPYPVEVHLILPNAPLTARSDFNSGDSIEIYQNPHYLSVLHAQKRERSNDDPVLSLTCVPLVYEREFAAPNGKTISISPPEALEIWGKSHP